MASDRALVTEWRLDQERRGLMPRTVYKRCTQATAWVRWCDDRDLTIATATTEDVQRFLDGRRSRDGRKIGARTRYHWISTLHVFYAWAVDAGHVAGDPTATIHRPRLRRSLPRPVSDADLEVALSMARPTMRSWLTLMALAGLRCAEVAGLTVGDLIEDRAMLRVVGKGDKERIVPLHPEALRAVELAGLPRRGRVFSRPLGGPWTPPLVSRVTNDYLRDIGVDATAHQFRHWFGTRTYAECRDIRVVQELMGHSSPVVTALYAAYSEEEARRAVLGLDVPGVAQSSLFAVTG